MLGEASRRREIQKQTWKGMDGCEQEQRGGRVAGCRLEESGQVLRLSVMNPVSPNKPFEFLCTSQTQGRAGLVRPRVSSHAVHPSHLEVQWHSRRLSVTAAHTHRAGGHWA